MRKTVEKHNSVMRANDCHAFLHIEQIRMDMYFQKGVYKIGFSAKMLPLG